MSTPKKKLARKRPDTATIAQIDAILTEKRTGRKFPTPSDKARIQAKWRHYSQVAREKAQKHDPAGAAAKQRKWNQASYSRRKGGVLPMKHNVYVNIDRLQEFGSLRIISLSGTAFCATRTFTREELAIALGYQPVTISRWLVRRILPAPPVVTSAPAQHTAQWDRLVATPGVITRRGVHVYTEAQVRRIARILEEHFNTTAVFLRTTHHQTVAKLKAAVAYRFDSPGGPPGEL